MFTAVQEGPGGASSASRRRGEPQGCAVDARRAPPVPAGPLKIWQRVSVAGCLANDSMIAENQVSGSGWEAIGHILITACAACAVQELEEYRAAVCHHANANAGEQI